MNKELMKFVVDVPTQDQTFNEMLSHLEKEPLFLAGYAYGLFVGGGTTELRVRSALWHAHKHYTGEELDDKINDARVTVYKK